MWQNTKTNFSLRCCKSKNDYLFEATQEIWLNLLRYAEAIWPKAIFNLIFEILTFLKLVLSVALSTFTYVSYFSSWRACFVNLARGHVSCNKRI